MSEADPADVERARAWIERWRPMVAWQDAEGPVQSLAAEFKLARHQFIIAEAVARAEGS